MPGTSPLGSCVVLPTTGVVVAAGLLVVGGTVPPLKGDADVKGAGVLPFVGEKVGLSVNGFPVGGLVGLGLIGPPGDDNGSFEGVAVGENVGPNVDGTLDGVVDGCEFCNEYGES